MSAVFRARCRHNRAETAGACGDLQGGSSLTVAFADSDATNRWVVSVWAYLIGGWNRVGQFTTSAPGLAKSRVIAVATVPGSEGWAVEAVRFEGPANATVTVQLRVSQDCSTPGLTAL